MNPKSCLKFEVEVGVGALQPDATINDEIRTTYKVVNPVCQESAAAAKKPVTSCKKSQIAALRIV